MRACTAGQTGGQLDASGNGVFRVTSPASGDLEGLALLSDRNNAGTLRLTGNDAGGVHGTFFAAAGDLTISGNGGRATHESAVVVGSLTMVGNACLGVTYAEDDNWTPPANLVLFE